MKNTVFTGAATAIVTPLTESGIDYDSFGRLIDFQIENGIDAIEFNISNDWDLYMALYGWDCDSILILNPNIIEMEV